MKYLLTIVLIGLCNPDLYSCSCAGTSPFLSTVKHSQVVLKGKVISHNNYNRNLIDIPEPYVNLLVTEVFKGTFNSDTIKVVESTGYECFGANFKDGEEYYIAGHIESKYETDSNGQYVFSKRLMYPTDCSESNLHIAQGKVTGNISLYLTKYNAWFYRLIGKLKKGQSKLSETMEILKLERQIKRLV